MKLKVEDPRTVELTEETLQKLRSKLAISSRFGATATLTQEEATYLLSFLEPKNPS